MDTLTQETFPDRTHILVTFKFAEMFSTPTKYNWYITVYGPNGELAFDSMLESEQEPIRSSNRSRLTEIAHEAIVRFITRKTEAVDVSTKTPIFVY